MAFFRASSQVIGIYALVFAIFSPAILEAQSLSLAPAPAPAPYSDGYFSHSLRTCIFVLYIFFFFGILYISSFGVHIIPIYFYDAMLHLILNCDKDFVKLHFTNMIDMTATKCALCFIIFVINDIIH